MLWTNLYCETFYFDSSQKALGKFYQYRLGTLDYYKNAYLGHFNLANV